MAGKISGEGFDQTARRSAISSNWRTNVDTSTKESANDAVRLRFQSPTDRSTQEGNTRPTVAGCVNTSIESQKTVRGENDPDTLQAIAEERRLYIGNMPYFAKVNDVRDIFEKAGHEVYIQRLVLLFH